MIIKKYYLNFLAIVLIFFSLDGNSKANIKNFNCKIVNVLVTLDERFLSNLDDTDLGSLLISGEDITFVYLGEKIDFKMSKRISSDSFTGISYSRVRDEDIKKYPSLKKNKGNITNMNLIYFRNALNMSYFEVDIFKINNLRWLEVDDIRSNGVDLETRKFICN